MFNDKQNHSGFTLVELLIVIVVIAILAAITIVTFVGAQNRAHETGIRSELTQASKQLELNRITNGRYPATSNDANEGSGLGTSGGSTVLQYTASADGRTYCLSGVSGSKAFHLTNSEKNFVVGVCAGHSGPGGTGEVAVGSVQYTSSASTTNSTQINLSSTPAEGNLLIATAVMKRDQAATLSLSGSGWNIASHQSNYVTNYYIYWKIATANEPTSLVANWSNAGINRLSVREFSLGAQNTTSPVVVPQDGWDGWGMHGPDDDYMNTAVLTPATSNSLIVAIGVSGRASFDCIEGDDSAYSWSNGLSDHRIDCGTGEPLISSAYKLNNSTNEYSSIWTWGDISGAGSHVDCYAILLDFPLN